MNNKLAGCLRTGDKIKLNNKEVTFNYLNNNYIKIQEDDALLYHYDKFCNFINGLDFDNLPKIKSKFYNIDLDTNGNFCLIKFKDNESIFRYNSYTLAKVIANNWVIMDKSNERVKQIYNPHIRLINCDNYRIDYYSDMIEDRKDLSSYKDKNISINFATGEVKVTKKRVNKMVCQICKKPLTQCGNTIGLYCLDCLKSLDIFKRYDYHYYRDGYKVYEDIDTTKIPVMGVELERDYDECLAEYDDDFCYNLNNSMKDIVKIMQSDELQAGKFKREFVFMCDGSLNNDGLEWITFPHSFKWYNKMKDKFNRAISSIESNGFCASSRTGTHIHINKDFFEDDYGKDNSNYCACKIALLLARYWDEFCNIANRSDTSYTEPLYLRDNDNIYDIIRHFMDDYDSHSVSVNMEHSKTVELRLWGECNNADDLMFFLDNTQALAQFAKNNGIEKILKCKFSDFMKYYKNKESLKIAYDRVYNQTYKQNISNLIKKGEKK